MNVVALDDHVAEIDTDPIQKAAIRFEFGIALGLGALHFDGAADSIDHAVELDQQTIAHSFHQATVMVSNFGLEDFVQIGLKTSARPFLIDLAQSAIAGDVSNQHRGEPALHARLPCRKTSASTCRNPCYARAAMTTITVRVLGVSRDEESKATRRGACVAFAPVMAAKY